jgi:hypothetical protein
MDNDPANLPSDPVRCATCGAKIKGDYCRKCGEKVIVPERDFSVSKFLTLFLGHVVHFDSKLVRSYGLLFSKPGFLTAEWTAGRRVRYMKPIQMFVVAGILFYFLFPNVSAYFSSIEELKQGYATNSWGLNYVQFDVERVLAEKAAVAHLDPAILEHDVAKSAGKESKTWLFLIIPLWGMVVFLFYRKRVPWLVPHLIFAMNCLTWYILADVSIHLIMRMLALSDSVLKHYILQMLMSLYVPYLLLAVRRFYGSPWGETLVKAILLANIFLFFMLAYRQLITVSAIYWY